jgi:hypothetical protein
LAQLVRDAIEARLDLDVLAEHREAEERDQTQILRALPTGDSDDDED